MAEIRVLYTRGKTPKNEFIKTDYRKDRYMHSEKSGLKAIMHKTESELLLKKCEINIFCKDF